MLLTLVEISLYKNGSIVQLLKNPFLLSQCCDLLLDQYLNHQRPRLFCPLLFFPFFKHTSHFEQPVCFAWLPLLIIFTFHHVFKSTSVAEVSEGQASFFGRCIPGLTDWFVFCSFWEGKRSWGQRVF